jgi:RNA polymerase sigma-70 factor, ECF subfamily
VILAGKGDARAAVLSNQNMVELKPASIESSHLDTRLLAQAQQGDAEAFGAVCQVVEARLLRQAILLCGDLSLAEDLAQETLIEAWKSLGRYNGRCQFFTWLCAILHHRYRNVLRRRRWLFLLNSGQPERLDVSSLLDQQPDHHAGPDQVAQAREQTAFVRRCVLALPAKHQQVIYLRFFVDDSLDGIAAALRCSVGTVKSRLFYALEKLRTMPGLREQSEEFNSKADVL